MGEPVQSGNGRSWHSLDVESVLAAMGTTDEGLEASEVAGRLTRFGPNSIPAGQTASLLAIVLRQFASPLIYVLLAAAVISVFAGDLKDASFIAAALMLNAAIGAWQEAQAEKNSHALRKLLRMQVLVERSGEVSELPAEAIVPGDILLLEAGNRVAADSRLISSHGLEIDESLLTGESLAVQKSTEWIGPPDTTLADRRNMVYAGSMATRGRARGVVVATGLATHVGQLARDVLEGQDARPPLIARMERFSNQIAVFVLFACIVIGTIGILVWNHTITDTILFIIALAVGCIPESLPVALTVALAVATTRMSRRNVLVRRLAAVEGLGSCTVIATDKTGTLTCNELTVREVQLENGTVFCVTGEGFEPKGEIRAAGSEQPVSLANWPALQHLIATGVLCNEAELRRRQTGWQWRGDAVDLAILSLGLKAGIARELLLNTMEQVSQIPFEPELQFAATYHGSDNGTFVAVKGAPEVVSSMCTPPLDQRRRDELESAARAMASRGLRVIALASGPADAAMPESGLRPRPSQLAFLGMIGLIDPLRPGVRESIAVCRNAGIAVTMITGDHRQTALAISRELGLANDEREVASGADIQHLSMEELAELSNRTRVFARVTPRQKLDIVNAMRTAGNVVAVTGDGVNDAPALTAAHIGVAMGKSGTDAAREASELVITDDNFRSIVAGVEEGRVAYDNVRKVVLLLLSTGAAEIVMVFLAVLTGYPLPLTAVQLLWLNLVTNGIQDIALAFEPGEDDVLRRKPRPPGEQILNRLMIERIAISSLVLGLTGFVLFAVILGQGWKIDEARNYLLLTMVLFEIVQIGNCRSETRSALTRSPFLNPVLLYGSIIALLLHLAVMYMPFLQGFLETRPIALSHWLIAAGLSLLALPAIESHKWLCRKRAARL
jgi:P-type Ca2+ transporter type 2C